MNTHRRAASRGHRAPSTGGLLTVAGVLTGLAATALAGAMAAIAGRVARMVVTPAMRIADTRVIDLDTSAQTITLDRSDDSRLPGRYGLFTTGTEQYVKLGSVLSETDVAVKRKLLTHIGPDARIGVDAAFSGWYYDRPEQLQIPFTPELIGSPVGPCPAWLFPASGGVGEDWVIQVHGRGATRAEALRAVPLFHDLGFTSLLTSYRNDGEAPRSRSGTYALGATEWRDIDAALGFARRTGARRVILMGWSMGGAIALQVALNSAHRDMVKGLVLDSPVVDWGLVLRYHAGQMRLPAPVVGLALGALGSEWASGVARLGERIPFDRLDVLARAGELRHPVLILHSDDDGFVPSDASHDLVAARPDLVELDVFDGARHTKLWNYDQDRWAARITRWLRQQGFAAGAAEDS